jgi:S1-C subfamily serine protease
MKNISFRFLAGLGLALGSLLSVAKANDFDAKGLGQGANQPIRRAALATVRIITGDVDQNGEFNGRGSGSGVIISPKGLVVTSNHVVTNSAGRAYNQLWAGLVDPRNEFMPPNRAVKLKLLAQDAALDLALLQIVSKHPETANFPHVPLGLTDALTYGAALTIVGFPAAGGPTTTALRVSVVGLDDTQGWIKVEGSLLHGASGGAAINERGELLGIASKVQADQAVTLFDENDVPAGLVTLGAVGYIRSVDAISGFLAKVATTANVAAPGKQTVLIGGILREKGTRQPIAGAIIAVLAGNTASPQGVVQQRELLAYGKSEFKGDFKLNRKLRPGKYFFKVIHPNFQTLIQEFVVSPNAADLEIELIR